MKKKLLILAGDGIGPEVMNEVKKIIVWFNKNKSSDFDITEELAGGISVFTSKETIESSNINHYNLKSVEHLKWFSVGVFKVLPLKVHVDTL
jgi:isocitrate/isopropylmalate dehydrogenase